MGIKSLIKPCLFAGILTGAYAGIGYYGVPFAVNWAVENLAPRYLGGRTCSVGSVAFDPWNLRLDIDDLQVHSAHNKTGRLLSVSRISTDVSSRSFVEFAPVLDGLSIDSLHAHVTSNAGNKREVSRSIAASKPKAADSAAPSSQTTQTPQEQGFRIPRFHISNLSVTSSDLRFVNAAAGADVKVENIELRLPVISTIDAKTATMVEPVFSCTVDGTPVKAKGNANTNSATLHLEIQDLDIAKLGKALPVELPVAIEKGHLSTSSTLHFLLNDQMSADIAVTGSAELAGIDIRNADGAKLFEAGNIKTAVTDLNLVQKRADISFISVIDPVLHVAIPKREPKKESPAPAAKPAVATKTTAQVRPVNAQPSAPAKWDWKLSDIAVTNGAVLVSDHNIAPGKTHLAIGSINLDGKKFSSLTNSTGPYNLTAVVGNGAVASNGHLSLYPLAVNGATEISGLDLATLNPWLAPKATITSGKLEVTGKLHYSEQNNSISWNGESSIANFKAQNRKQQNLMTWTKASLDKVNLKSADPLYVTIGSLTITEPAQKAVQTASKILGLIGMFARSSGHDSTAERIDKIGRELSRDISIRDISYENGKFSAHGRDRESLENLAIDKLNDVFAGH